MLTELVIQFLFFSFIGWIIDSSYITIYDKKLTNAGYFRGPFCPTYGFGGVTLVFLLKYLPTESIIFKIIISSLMMTLVEYLGGIFCETFLKVRVWDYSKTTFNIGGHIDLLHSFYWIILVIVFNYSIFPLALWFEKSVTIPIYFNMPVFLIFVITFMWLTIRKSPEQFFELKDKVMNLSVTDYQILYSNFKKMLKAKSEQSRKKFREKIKHQLKKAKISIKVKR